MRSRLVSPALLLACMHLCAEDFEPRAHAHIQALADQGKFQGSVLVASGGKPVFRRSYGFANAEWEIPNTPDTKFRLGSITKQFTAMAILQLVDAGKLKLDDPVSKYYNGAPAAWDKVTIHHLLTHTSGIPSYSDMPGFFAKSSRDPKSALEIIKLTQDQPLLFAPGEKMRYNNTGYVLLGYLIEVLSGESYAGYLKNHIFAPLGMKDSGYDFSALVLKKRASGYAADGSNAAYLDMSLPHAAGGLYSTVDDMLLWDGAIASGKLLSKESYEKYFTPFKNNYAYGWFISSVAGKKTIGHGGGIHGFNTAYLRAPDEQLSVVVLANKNGPTADKLAVDLIKIYFGETLATAAPGKQP
ncbi:MAG TPA: serine hydrolase domain-containing protein [Bryobacteraceae bacterium]|nr:serine hydrolase domain-containing protein [Bryobacteraceae bacterium]